MVINKDTAIETAGSIAENMNRLELLEFIIDDETNPQNTFGQLYNTLQENNPLAHRLFHNTIKERLVEEGIIEESAREPYIKAQDNIDSMFKEFKGLEDQISRKEWNKVRSLLHDGGKNLAQAMDYVRELADKYDLDNLTEDYDEIFDLEDELQQEISKIKKSKNQAINKIIRKAIVNESYFEKQKVLRQLSKNNIKVPNLDKIQEDSFLNESEIDFVPVDNYYDQVKEALSVIRPIDEPLLNAYQHRETIQDELRDNLDSMLFEKVQTFIRTKDNADNNFIHLKETNNKVKAEIDSFKKSQMAYSLGKLPKKTNIDLSSKDQSVLVFTVNKLQTKLLDYFGQFSYGVDELEKEIETSRDQIKIVIANLKKRDLTVPDYQTIISNIDGVLGEWLSLEQALKELNPLITSIQENLQNHLGKEAEIKHAHFFDGSKEKIKNKVIDTLVIKEHQNEEGSYIFNILHEAFTPNNHNIEEQIKDSVQTKLMNKYNTTNALNKKNRKEFQLDESIDVYFKPVTKETVDLKIDTTEGSKQVRVHLQEKMRKGQQEIDYSIEFSPKDFNEGRLVKDAVMLNENIDEDFEKKQTKKAFEIFLLDGNNYELNDNTTLWYSHSDKKWMKEMEAVSFDDLYYLYSTANKDNSIKSRNGLNESSPNENTKEKLYKELENLQKTLKNLKDEDVIKKEILNYIDAIEANIEMVESKTSNRKKWTAVLIQDGEEIDTKEKFDNPYPAKFLKELEKEWKATNLKVNNEMKLITFTK